MSILGNAQVLQENQNITKKSGSVTFTPLPSPYLIENY